MKKTLLALLLASAFQLLMIQHIKAGNMVPDPKGGSISGRIVDASSNQPMEYVSVALFRASDSSLVTGAISNPDGKFKLEKISAGAYYLKISFLGFQNLQTDKIVISSKTMQNEMGDLKLTANTAELSGVSVVGERSKVEYKIDKRVINVGQDLVAQGGTAVNALENTPSVQVDAQGNVSLRGSYDYIVLIDGKPSVLKGSEALKQINAASIKQIEVITNPSAKYESDGKAGIINIIQKKEKMQGVSGTGSLSLGTRDKYSANGLVNYRKKKVNVFAGIDFAKNKYETDLEIRNLNFLETGTRHMDESVTQYNNNDNLGGKAGIDYDLNEKNAFTLSGNYGVQGYDNGASAKYNSYTEGSEQKYWYSSNNTTDVAGRVAGLNLDYTHKFGENHSLSVSNYYSSWDGEDENLLTEYTTDENYEPISTNSALTYKKDNFNFQYRLNADYKRMINTGTLEAGFQYRYEFRKDDYVFKNLDTENNEWVVNPMYTYKLDYDNDIYSGYVTFSDTKWGIGYMLGLRSEYFTRTISFSNDEVPYNYDKFMLYPSIHLTKSVKEKHQFQLSYSRRINRPQPWVLNKTPGYIDPYNIFQGSPELEPEYTDAFEFNYRLSYKIMSLSAQTYYRNTTNCFNTIRTLQDDGVMVHELINANSQQSYGSEIGLNFNIKKWWQLSTSANVYHYTLEADISSGETTRSSNSWDGRLITSFSLKKGTRLQGVFYMRGPQLDAQGESEGFYTVNLGASQQVLKGKLNLGVSAENIFNSIKFDYSASGVNYDNTYSIAVEGMVLRVTASYTFNNFQNKQRGRADDASFKGGGAF
jgi:outer membrane receptor protein involved in Fe transport